MKRFLAIFLGIACISLLFAIKSNWQTILRIGRLGEHHPEWMLQQIRKDLSSFPPNALHPSRLDLVPQKDPVRCYARYRINNNQLESSLIHPHNSIVPKRFSSLTQSMQELLQKHRIPNVDFLVCLEDECDRAALPAPVFAFAKDSTLNESVILIPDFEALEGNPQLLKSVHKGIQNYPWTKRKAQAIWRGGTTGAVFSLENFLSAPRSQLVTYSLSYPEWIDAKFSGLCICQDIEEIRKQFSVYFDKPRSVRGHLAYKYQILIDGNSSAYSRAYWQLFSQSLIFKIDSPHIQWYYGSLQPYVHYIPVAADLHDLIDKIRWARDHDENAQQISQNAFRFAQSHLKKSDVFLYLFLLLREYALLQKQTEGTSLEVESF